MSTLSHSSRIYMNDLQADVVPKKQQWSLIYKQKADEYQKLKLLQKVKDRQKKQAFKNQLDSQINGKNNINQLQKDQDKKYYQFITLKAEQMKQKQLRQKYQKFNKRKQVQQINQHFLQMNHQRSRSSNSNYQRNNYSFDIGLASQLQKKKMEEIGKRKMLDALDQQINMKVQQQRLQKLKNIQLEQQNLKYQEDKYIDRMKGGKNYGQNQNIYQYYQDLTLQRLRKQRQLQYRMIDEAAYHKQQEQLRRKKQNDQKKYHLSIQMKQTLDHQVQFHNHLKQLQAKVNPQENSYSIIGSMFRDKGNYYDKRQYSEYLLKQAQQQKRKKMLENHMTPEQYKINLNQLNKAVTGTYAYDQYHDRSLTAIGEKQSKLNNLIDSKNKVHEDVDTEIIRNRLQNIKNRKPQIMQQSH